MACLIDTHNHMQSEQFDHDRPDVFRRAKESGVGCALIAAGISGDWTKCLRVGAESGWCVGLGVHPLATARPTVTPEVADELRDALRREMADPASRVVAVAEIGLDGFVPDLDRAKQEAVFVAQLKVARDTGMPVSLHVRRSVDWVTKWLRRIPVSGGVAHAVNGSEEQARSLSSVGHKLGFGGAMMYSGSRRIRRLAATLPLESIVLETDAPDMPSGARRDSGNLRTEPADIAGYLDELAQLRGMPRDELLSALQANSLAAFPGMREFLPERQKN